MEFVKHSELSAVRQTEHLTDYQHCEALSRAIFHLRSFFGCRSNGEMLDQQFGGNFDAMVNAAHKCLLESKTGEMARQPEKFEPTLLNQRSALRNGVRVYRKARQHYEKT